MKRWEKSESFNSPINSFHVPIMKQMRRPFPQHRLGYQTLIASINILFGNESSVLHFIVIGCLQVERFTFQCFPLSLLLYFLQSSFSVSNICHLNITEKRKRRRKCISAEQKSSEAEKNIETYIHASRWRKCRCLNGKAYKQEQFLPYSRKAATAAQQV